MARTTLASLQVNSDMVIYNPTQKSHIQHSRMSLLFKGVSYSIWISNLAFLNKQKVQILGIHINKHCFVFAALISQWLCQFIGIVCPAETRHSVPVFLLISQSPESISLCPFLWGVVTIVWLSYTHIIF